jgi:hypothetical protein
MLSLSAWLPRARGLGTFGAEPGNSRAKLRMNSAMAIAVAVVGNAIVNREAIPANRSADGGVKWRRFRPFGSELSRTSSAPSRAACPKSWGPSMRRNEGASDLSAVYRACFKTSCMFI